MARIPALIVMHGGGAAGFLGAAQKVMGDLEDVTGLSNEDCSGPVLEAEIEKHVGGWASGGIVFTDFWGGSCHLAAMAVARRRPEIVLITGLNVPMLLDYLHNRERLGLTELAERLRLKGQEGIRIHRSQPA